MSVNRGFTRIDFDLGYNIWNIFSNYATECVGILEARLESVKYSVHTCFGKRAIYQAVFTFEPLRLRYREKEQGEWASMPLEQYQGGCGDYLCFALRSDAYCCLRDFKNGIHGSIAHFTYGKQHNPDNIDFKKTPIVANINVSVVYDDECCDPIDPLEPPDQWTRVMYEFEQGEVTYEKLSEF